MVPSSTVPAFPSLTKTIVGMRIAALRNQGSTADRPGRWPGAPDEELWFGRPFDPADAVFDRRAPLEVEIGSGKARFLVASARACPAHDFLGIERSLSYYRLCRERVDRASLSNARVLRADGRIFVETALAPASVRAFHVYFPDPWPKKKQKKRRLLDGIFLELLASRLEPGGHAPHRDRSSRTTARSSGPLLETVGAFERVDVGEPAVHAPDPLRAQVPRAGPADLAVRRAARP